MSAHFFNVVTYALGCAGARPCRQWAINASAADIRRTAAIMRQIASQLISGDCRTAWSRNATRDDQLGQALVLYGRSLLVRNGSTRRQEQARAGRLTEQAERLAVPVPALLETCAPHGQALGRPELT